MSASYLYLLLDIDSEDRFRTKLYNKGDTINYKSLRQERKEVLLYYLARVV